MNYKLDYCITGDIESWNLGKAKKGKRASTVADQEWVNPFLVGAGQSAGNIPLVMEDLGEKQEFGVMEILWSEPPES